jgi:hypothetical protein
VLWVSFTGQLGLCKRVLHKLIPRVLLGLLYPPIRFVLFDGCYYYVPWSGTDDLPDLVVLSDLHSTVVVIVGGATEIASDASAVRL